MSRYFLTNETVADSFTNCNSHTVNADHTDDDDGETSSLVPYLAPPQRARFTATDFFSSSACTFTLTAGASDERNNNAVSKLEKDSCGVDKKTELENDLWGVETTALEKDDDKNILRANLEALFNDTIDLSFSTGTIPVCSYLLRNYFGIATGQFRTGQQEVVLSILRKRNTLAVFPTGWGKTLCFQFPILIHRLLFAAELRTWQAAMRQSQQNGIIMLGKPPEARFAVVVSPLLSLMTEQAGRIAKEGNLRTAVLSSGTSQLRAKAILDELSSSMCSIDLVFVSPERLVRNIELRSVLEKHMQRIAFICVDEVHCVSQWAYDFRPSFMYVHRVLASLGGANIGTDGKKQLPPFLCLTATAAPSVINELKVIFCIERTVKVPYCRDNLCLEAVPLVDASCPRPPTQQMIQKELLQAVLELPKPMLVYVQTRVDADEFATFLASKLGAAQATKELSGSNCVASSTSTSLSSPSIFTSATHAQLRRNDGFDGARKNCISIRSYHAALERHVRTKTQKQFMQGSIDVLIATVAFGMGIDKANIRTVVHASAPASLESYVQETGRSGRDGEKAFCRLLYNPFDFYTLRSRLLASYLSQTEVVSIVQHILDSPTTEVGERVMLVSVSRISEELVISEETVETVLFLLLLCEGELLRELIGMAPMSYTVSRAAAEVVVTAEENSTGRKRRRGATKLSGVSGVLAQLDVLDGVFEFCRQSSRIENVVTTANSLKLSLHDFQFRLNDLVAGGFLSVREQLPAYVVLLGDQFAELSALPERRNAVAERLWRMHHERHEAMVRALEVTFSVLHHPTHDAVLWGLEWDGSYETCEGVSVKKWQPPPRTLTKMEAVSITNDFVEKNRLRIRSTHEAARTLLGVYPKPIANRGKFASELPLTLSWYVLSPYFGLLKEFELQWLLKVLLPHRLDEAQSTHVGSCLQSS